MSNNLKSLIDNALRYGEEYQDERATSEEVFVAEEAFTDIEKLAAALDFIAVNLDDLEPTAEEKLAEAEMLVGYLNDLKSPAAIESSNDSLVGLLRSRRG
jgi:hypothetical protein